MKAVLVDMDGTLALIDHRLKYVRDLPEGTKKDWNSFFDYDEIMKDKPNLPVFDIVRGLWQMKYKILIVSARPRNKCHKATVNWLENNLVVETGKEDSFTAFTYEKLYMRGDTTKHKDMRPDTEVKSDLLDMIIADGYEPYIVIDDRKSVVDMWRSKGIFVAHVAEGNF